MNFFIRVFFITYWLFNAYYLPAQEIACSGIPELSAISIAKLNANDWKLIHSDVANLPGARPALDNRKSLTPWLALGAVPFVAGGIAAHFKSRDLHEDYRQSSETDEAVKLRKEVKQMELLRNVSLGIAGALGLTGIVVCKKEYRKNRNVRIEYLPFACSGSLCITF